MRWRIRYQLLVPLLVLLLGVVGVSIWGAMDAATRVRRGIETRVREVARILSEAPQFPLVAPVLEQMKSLSGADYLLATEHGHVSTLTATPAELPPVGAVVDDWRTLGLGPRMVVDGEAYLGSGVRLRPPRERDILYILYPESLWRNALWEALVPVLAMGGAVGLASVALAFGLGQRLSRRIDNLERRTRLIAAGDFSPMPLPAGNDEVRDLARSVNEMAEKLAQFQEAVRRTERLRLLGQVSGGLAHQLRNSLTGARLAVQVYLQEHEDQPETDALEVALRQLTLMETNLKRFLELGRQDNPRRLRCDLAGLVGDVVELLRPGCRHAGIDLRWQAPAGDSSVRGDVGQLGQLIVNVVSNAVEAAGPGGMVKIQMVNGRSGENGKSHVLEIWDNGKGPSPDVAGRLFEPFATGKPEGVGLGLAVARQVAEAHGGQISWRRERNQTCFRIELPAGREIEPDGKRE